MDLSVDNVNNKLYRIKNDHLHLNSLMMLRMSTMHAFVVTVQAVALDAAL